MEVSNGNGEVILVKKYKRQAAKLFWCIAAGEPTPEFLIEKSDMPDKIRKELEENTSVEWCQVVLKEAVGRIFEEVDFDHYHLSVAKNLRVGLV